jgi:hypothetical protein
MAVAEGDEAAAIEAKMTQVGSMNSAMEPRPPLRTHGVTAAAAAAGFACLSLPTVALNLPDSVPKSTS